MKHVAIWIVALCLSFGALAQDNASYHGKKITPDNAVPSTELAAKLGDKKELPLKV